MHFFIRKKLKKFCDVCAGLLLTNSAFTSSALSFAVFNIIEMVPDAASSPFPCRNSQQS